MLVKIKAKTNCKKSSIEKIAEDSFLIKVKSKPERGVANKEVLELLSNFLSVERERLKIIKGSREKTKIIKIF